MPAQNKNWTLWQLRPIKNQAPLIGGVYISEHIFTSSQNELVLN